MATDVIGILNAAIWLAPARARLDVAARVMAWAEALRSGALRDLAERERREGGRRGSDGDFIDAEGFYR
jgi:hypothetical protein